MELSCPHDRTLRRDLQDGRLSTSGRGQIVASTLLIACGLAMIGFVYANGTRAAVTSSPWHCLSSALSARSLCSAECC
jgi:hypothetical protein